MTRCLLLVISLLLTLASIAAPKIYLVDNNGSWNDNSTWDLNRKPQIGDTVIIPLGKKVIIEDNINLNGTIYLKVWGRVEVDGGKLNLGENSTIFVHVGGRIFGHDNSDKIRIGNVEKFRGTDPDIFSLAIPFIANSTTGAGFASVTLPVKYLGFSVARRDNDVLIQWGTAEEQNADFYEVERSIDGTSWSPIGRVLAAGTTSATTHYSYTDKNVPATTVYYRIKQVDADRRFVYTPIRSVTGEETSSPINITAVSGRVVVQFDQELKSVVDISIVAANGQVVSKRTVNRPSGQVVLEGGGLKGIYIVSITTAQGTNQATKIVL